MVRFDTCARCARSFQEGSVVSVSVLGQPVVVLDTIEACVNLLDKRSRTYSGRPILPFAGKM